MPSFDTSSEMDWQELDNAVQQTIKESNSRYDFKGVKSEIKLDRKENTLTLWISETEKLTALKDILQTKLIKRGLSLLSFDFKEKEEEAFGGSVRTVATIQAEISKEKGKEIIQVLKESKLKVQAQIQDGKVRVTGKNRDDLQEAIALLRSKQETVKLPLQFGNFRD